jgi:glutathione S-transferase
MSELVIVGRSSSHFTRPTRIFALELGIPHAFRPVLDLTSLDPGNYAGNPALQVPILVDGEGPLFGMESICRALARRAPARPRVVLRGEVADRIVANAEEMILHVMSTEVTLVTAKMARDDRAAPTKLHAGLQNALRFLDGAVERVIAALPADRALSFVEVTLFCMKTHLPFRGAVSGEGYANLDAFCARFGERESARATPYRFDAA